MPLRFALIINVVGTIPSSFNPPPCFALNDGAKAKRVATAEGTVTLASKNLSANKR
jgi:hypothetical protein